jgi:metal-sulfur cluster biosynthetic enzyme
VTWDAEIAAALEAVQDPCSVAAGAPMSLLDMGLVRGWEVSPDGDLDVRLDVTAPVCLMAGHFVADAQARLSAIDGVGEVTVRIDPSGDWSPERISARGRELLAARRRPPPSLEA